MHNRRNWGRVTARPHQYLIQLRGGRIVKHGAGLSVFKYPWDSISCIPTSVQRATFVADQVTSEKVGVEVRGVAVFRVANPLLAFKMLEFDTADAMTQVIGILQDMLVGAARRLVAAERTKVELERERESRRTRSEMEAELLPAELQSERARGELAVELRRIETEVDNSVSDERIKYALVAEALPEIAKYFAQSRG